VVDAVTAAKLALEGFGGMIDAALRLGAVDCEEVVTRYDLTVALPALDTTGAPGEAVAAHEQYRQALAIFSDGARDMTQNCRDFLANPESGTIPFQQWGLARMRVNEAVAVLNAALALLK
jgi:hypothetical protein